MDFQLLPKVVLRRLDRTPDVVVWDNFAAQCNASLNCSMGAIAARRLLHRLYFFEFYLDGHKIGQCAVGRLRGFRRYLFLDSIQLRACFKDHWGDAMRAILDSLGSGRYYYGSRWSLVAARVDEDFHQIRGVRLISHEIQLVQAVDFAAWPDWESYHKAVSTNAKRNAAKAIKTDPNTRIEYLVGWQSIPFFASMVKMRSSMHRRKGDYSSNIPRTLRFLGRLLFMHRYIRIGRVFHHDVCSAFLVLVAYGDLFYYTEGSSIANNSGSAWYLTIEMLRDLRRKCPTGKFISGNVEPPSPITPEWIRSQAMTTAVQCKSAEFSTSIALFDYRSP